MWHVDDVIITWSSFTPSKTVLTNFGFYPFLWSLEWKRRNGNREKLKKWGRKEEEGNEKVVSYTRKFHLKRHIEKRERERRLLHLWKFILETSIIISYSLPSFLPLILFFQSPLFPLIHFFSLLSFGILSSFISMLDRILQRLYEMLGRGEKSFRKDFRKDFHVRCVTNFLLVLPFLFWTSYIWRMFTGLCTTPRIRLRRERIRCKNEGRGKKEL